MKKEKYKIKFLAKINYEGKPYLYIGKIGTNIMNDGLYILVSEKTKKVVQICGDFEKI